MDDLPRCRCCASTDLVDLGACPRPPSAGANHDPGRLLRCRRCALGQRHPIPSDEAIAAMYVDASAEEMSYDYEANAAWASARRMLHARFSGRPDVAVLDIGCHTGRFLAGLPEAWARHGIESAREPSRAAREQARVDIIGTRLEHTDAAWARRFDVVTMFDVIEHLPDPGVGIAQAARLVKPGGVLLISSGDLDARTWRWLGSGHWYLQTPQHLAVISRPFLEFVGQRERLRLREVQSIPHRRAALATRCNEAVRAAYWATRQRGGAWRLPRRILQSTPGLRQLRHMQSVPWTMALQDHLLAAYDC